MWEDIQAKEAQMAKRYTKSQRHTIQVDYIPFMDELAELVGCKPDIGYTTLGTGFCEGHSNIAVSGTRWSLRSCAQYAGTSPRPLGHSCHLVGRHRYWQVELFKKDPRLATHVFFGPCTPYQYRLTGPGKWDGAREAILTTMDRVRFPLATRPASLPWGHICASFCLLLLW